MYQSFYSVLLNVLLTYLTGTVQFTNIYSVSETFFESFSWLCFDIHVNQRCCIDQWWNTTASGSFWRNQDSCEITPYSWTAEERTGRLFVAATTRQGGEDQLKTKVTRFLWDESLTDLVICSQGRGTSTFFKYLHACMYHVQNLPWIITYFLEKAKALSWSTLIS